MWTSEFVCSLTVLLRPVRASAERVEAEKLQTRAMGEKAVVGAASTRSVNKLRGSIPARSRVQRDNLELYAAVRDSDRSCAVATGQIWAADRRSGGVRSRDRQRRGRSRRGLPTSPADWRSRAAAGSGACMTTKRSMAVGMSGCGGGVVGGAAAAAWRRTSWTGRGTEAHKYRRRRASFSASPAAGRKISGRRVLQK